MQLVDKRKLISDVESIGAEFGNDNSSLIEQGDVLDMIEEAPAVDAVPVVRCRDCINRGKDDCPMHIKGTFLLRDYCSYGNRSDKNAADDGDAIRALESVEGDNR